MYVQKLPDNFSFEKVGIKGKRFPRLENQKSGFSIIETEKGHETRIIETKCDFCYYILEGSGSFEIEGIKEECMRGDLVVIPSGKPFQYFGKLKMLLVSTPPWYLEQEITLD